MGKGLYKKISYLFSCLLDVFYPEASSCSLCGRVLKEDSRLYLCSGCLSQLKFIGSKDVFCESGINMAPAFEKCYSVCTYEGMAREMVHRLKYNGKREIAESMAALMEKVVKENKLRYDLIVPVPSSKKRMRKRGYNQSELIAEALSNLVNIPTKNVLVKNRDTSSQVLYNAEKRWYNVKGSFSCNISLKGISILLIDDVVTTGATAHFSAEELIAKGAVSVTIMSFAKSTSL